MGEMGKEDRTKKREDRSVTHVSEASWVPGAAGGPAAGRSPVATCRGIAARGCRWSACRTSCRRCSSTRLVAPSPPAAPAHTFHCQRYKGICPRLETKMYRRCPLIYRHLTPNVCGFFGSISRKLP
jgi:hypothetical protein